MIRREIEKAWSFYREKGLRQTTLCREAPFLIQFGKYGICGILSVVVLGLMIVAGEFLFPEFFNEDLVSPETRARNNIVLHLIAFIPSNFTAYFLNRWLVFTPGRHSFTRELILFSIISVTSFGAGELLQYHLIINYGTKQALAHASFVVSSALVNFACRKFLVFEK
jgi:putative flippase GtrA